MLEQQSHNETNKQAVAQVSSEQATHAETAVDLQTESGLVLLAQVRRDVALGNRLSRCVYAFYYLVLLPTIGFSLYQMTFGNHHYFQLINLFNAVNLGIGAIGRKMLNKNAVERLAKWKDKRHVGVLVDVVNPRRSINYDSYTRQSIKRVLVSLLPTLRADDADLLTEDQREVLRKMLISERDAPELQIALLTAFEQIGDWRCVPAVEKLIQRTENTKVRKAAGECLPYLTEIAEKQKVSQSLLRASDAPTEQEPETLLRAASGTETRESPDELLRAGSMHEA